MALVIYDHGYRIQTPTRSEFPPKGVSALTEPRAPHRIADAEDKAQADGEKFIQQIAPHSRKRKQRPRRSATLAYAETEEKARGLADRRNLVLSHMMTSPVQTIQKGATIFTAWRKMEDLQIRHLVVVNEENQPLGMLSERDILKAGKNSSQLIETIYTKEVIAASPDTQVRHVAQSFVEYNINSMPIVDDKDRVIGIITRTDLLHLLVSGPNLEHWA
ncbi:MAG: HPP family protein [Pontibacterium sp.]